MFHRVIGLDVKLLCHPKFHLSRLTVKHNNLLILELRIYNLRNLDITEDYLRVHFQSDEIAVSTYINLLVTTILNALLDGHR